MPWGSLGVFGVGFTEVEWVREDGQNVVGRIHYPAAKPSARVSSWLTPWRWRPLHGVPWLWDINYARGVGKFLFFRLPKTAMYKGMKQTLIAIAWALGKSQRMEMTPGAALAPDAPAQLPLVIFSHGLGGNRFMYSIICAELASQGYVVLSVEHLDGTACAARRPGGEWQLYGGLGDEAAQVAKTRVRVAEMKAALQLMQALHEGDAQQALKLDYGLPAASFLKGRLDLRCTAAVGHSYGGATITALVAEDPLFRCGVALDPWWYALPPESKALSRFATRAPLLVVGSHDWNTPNAFGQLSCGGERQEAVLAAAAVRADAGGRRTGGGAMLLSIAGSSHNTFADALPLFGQQTGWLLERLGLSARLDPVLGIYLCTTAILHFLGLHLPLSDTQRAAQNWEPAKGHPGLSRILERDAADAGEGRGLLSWLFPSGRGLINAASDYLLDRLLPKPAAFRQGPGAPPPTTAAPQAAPARPAPLANGAPDEPSDLVTGVEAAEAALPSADPVSGKHPHAPGAASHTHQPSGRAGAANGGLDAKRGRDGSPPSENGESGGDDASVLRAGVNRRYSSTVERREVEDVRALLGQEHIFKCLVT